MSFLNFWGGKPNNTPSPTYLQTQKSKQIESLRKIPATVTETIRDVEYRVTFLVNSTNITLVLSLSPNFPQDQPMVKVEPGVHHPWVDNQMRLASCPAILSFTMHSSLGSAVQSIVEEFQRNPPKVISQHSYGNPSGPLPYSLPSAAYPQTGYPEHPSSSYPRDMAPPSGYPEPQSLSRDLTRTPSLSSYTSQMSTDESNREESRKSSYQMPEIHATFPALTNKSMTELNDLMNDEAKMLELLQQQPQLEKIAVDRKEMSKTCEDLARSNLSRKPEVENLKASIIKQWEEMNEVKTKVEGEIGRLSMLGDQFHPSIIQTNLKVAALEAEEESEKIAEDFLDKKLDIEAFTLSFMKARSLCHSRRAKEEKLQQILLSHGHQY